MAFTAARTVVLGAGVAVALPAISDGANNPGFTLYSHMRVPGGRLTRSIRDRQLWFLRPLTRSLPFQ
jgi:hypothetical protein